MSDFVGHILGTPGWAEQKVWRQTHEVVGEMVVDGRRLELPTSALRTSPVARAISLAHMHIGVTRNANLYVTKTCVNTRVSA